MTPLNGVPLALGGRCLHGKLQGTPIGCFFFGGHDPQLDGRFAGELQIVPPRMPAFILHTQVTLTAFKCAFPHESLEYNPSNFFVMKRPIFGGLETSAHSFAIMHAILLDNLLQVLFLGAFYGGRRGPLTPNVSCTSTAGAWRESPRCWPATGGRATCEYCPVPDT